MNKPRWIEKGFEKREELNIDNKQLREIMMNVENIINQTNASEVDSSIRQEINEQFASEKNTDSKVWENETEILDSIAESERLRNERLGIVVEEAQDSPTTKIKNKKKKRFFFF